MSQFPAASPHDVRPGSNRLGFWGFICSVLGFVCTAGVLCPIGFLLSLFALRKNPRGFAIAGSVIGGVGTLLCILLILVSLLTIGVAKGISTAIKRGVPYVKSVADGASLYNQIDIYRKTNSALPKSLDDLHVDSDALIDGWGHKFHYQLNDDGSFNIISDGPDGKQGTLDDIRSTNGKVAPHKLRGKRLRGAV